MDSGLPTALQQFRRLFTLNVDLVPKLSGVYFLCREQQVVYVGQSVDIYSRLRAHQDFDAAFAILLDRSDLNTVEGAFIRLLRPVRNRIAPLGTPEADAEAIARELREGWRLTGMRIVHGSTLPARPMKPEKLRAAIELFHILPDDALTHPEVAAAILNYHPKLPRRYVTPRHYGYRVGDVRKLSVPL